MRVKRSYVNRRGFYLSILCIFFMSYAAHAESIIELQSGSTFKANFLSEEGDFYLFDISGTEVSIKKSLVNSIRKEEKKNEPQEMPKQETGSNGEEIVSEDKEKKVKPEVLGSILGNITLPSVQGKGKLYVWFVPQDKENKEIATEKYYQIIKAEDITANKVSFAIENVPAGEYKGFVNWDIAEPKWKSSWGEGNFLSLPGDYTGVTEQNIRISPGERIKEVNIECVFYLQLMGKGRE